LVYYTGVVGILSCSISIFVEIVIHKSCDKIFFI
jgi:hypothetical protein